MTRTKEYSKRYIVILINNIRTKTQLKYNYLLISWEICCDMDQKIVIDRGDIACNSFQTSKGTS